MVSFDTCLPDPKKVEKCCQAITWLGDKNIFSDIGMDSKQTKKNMDEDIEYVLCCLVLLVEHEAPAWFSETFTFFIPSIANKKDQ